MIKSLKILMLISFFLLFIVSKNTLLANQYQYDGKCDELEDVINLPKGHWCEVPNSHLRDVAPCGGTPGGICNSSKGDPTQECYNSYAVYNFSHIIWGWNGGAFDTKRDRLIIFGGGHRGWAGNDIYTFDINTLNWIRVKDASCITAEDLDYNEDLERTGYYLADDWKEGEPYQIDQQKPRARHTYNYIQYVPAIDRFCSFGGGGFSYSGQTGAPNVDCFNFETLEWEKRTDTPVYGVAAFSAVDPITGYVWVRGTTHRGLAEYNPESDSWTKRGDTPGSSSYSKTAAIDPKRHRLVAVGGGEVWMWNIDQPGTLTLAKIDTEGGDAILRSDYSDVSGPYPGFVYDSLSEKFVGWNGGANVYTLDIDTNTWTKHEPDKKNVITPTATARHDGDLQGTYGRFRYSPNFNVFIVVNSVDENVYLYRLSPTEVDNTPPSAPTGLKVE